MAHIGGYTVILQNVGISAAEKEAFMMTSRQLERVVRGFSNHRRIQMLMLVAATPELDVFTLARTCGVDVRTASEHTQKLVRGGLLRKRSEGRRVLHTVSPRGADVLRFLRSLK